MLLLHFVSSYSSHCVCSSNLFTVHLSLERAHNAYTRSQWYLCLWARKAFSHNRSYITNDELFSIILWMHSPKWVLWYFVCANDYCRCRCCCCYFCGSVVEFALLNLVLSFCFIFISMGKCFGVDSELESKNYDKVEKVPRTFCVLNRFTFKLAF